MVRSRDKGQRPVRYHVTLKQLSTGGYYARCDSGPTGLLETQGSSREEVLSQMHKEIEYRLELCPCSRPARDSIELGVR